MHRCASPRRCPRGSARTSVQDRRSRASAPIRRGYGHSSVAPPLHDTCVVDSRDVGVDSLQTPISGIATSSRAPRRATGRQRAALARLPLAGVGSCDQQTRPRSRTADRSARPRAVAVSPLKSGEDQRDLLPHLAMDALEVLLRFVHWRHPCPVRSSRLGVTRRGSSDRPRSRSARAAASAGRLALAGLRAALATATKPYRRPHHEY